MYTKTFPSSKRSHAINPIRTLIEKEFKIPTDLPRPLVNLTLGEPTKENGFPQCDAIKQSVIDIISSEKHNGYTASNGALVARQAVVDLLSTERAPFTSDHVILTMGASGALYTSLQALCEEGDNILMP